MSALQCDVQLVQLVRSLLTFYPYHIKLDGRLARGRPQFILVTLHTVDDISRPTWLLPPNHLKPSLSSTQEKVASPTAYAWPGHSCCTRISTPAPSCNDYTAVTVAPVQPESFLQDGRGQHLFVRRICLQRCSDTDSSHVRLLVSAPSIRVSEPKVETRPGPLPPPPKSGPRRSCWPLETMNEKDEHPVYPQYCFHLSPTINRFCPLRSGDIESLTTHPGFAGAPITTLAPSHSPALILLQDKTSSSTETFPCDGSVSPAW